jgi:hypothetical protein
MDFFQKYTDVGASATGCVCEEGKERNKGRVRDWPNRSGWPTLSLVEKTPELAPSNPATSSAMRSRIYRTSSALENESITRYPGTNRRDHELGFGSMRAATFHYGCRDTRSVRTRESA